MCEGGLGWDRSSIYYCNLGLTVPEHSIIISEVVPRNRLFNAAMAFQAGLRLGFLGSGTRLVAIFLVEPPNVRLHFGTPLRDIIPPLLANAGWVSRYVASLCRYFGPDLSACLFVDLQVCAAVLSMFNKVFMATGLDGRDRSISIVCVLQKCVQSESNTQTLLKTNK